MASASRWSMTQEVDVVCPRCQRLLPPLPLRTVVRASGKRTLRLDVIPELTDGWWAQARAEHPRCTPPGAGWVERTDGGDEVLEG